MRLSKARPGSALQKAATSAMASVATTAKGDAASRPAPVIFSPNFATSVSWMALASMATSHRAVGRAVEPGPGEAADREAALARHAVLLDLLLQLQEAVEERLGPRRAAGHVDVHRDHLVDALEDVVAVPPVGPAVVRAGAHRQHVLGLRHLRVEPLDARRHLQGHGAGDDHEVGLARRAAGHDPEALRVVAARARGHHLDGAAGEAERHEPDAVLAAPVDELVGAREDEPVAEAVVDETFDFRHVSLRPCPRGAPRRGRPCARRRPGRPPGSR